MEQTLAPLRTPATGRIGGIDMARALAIVGMVMVHIGPQSLAGGGLGGAAYRASHGRASIVFIVLAGIGVSLLAGDRSQARIVAARQRLAWRTLVLLPAGLALQTLDVDVAVILQYYAIYFLVAAAVVRWSDRALLTLAAVSATVGPVVVLVAARFAPSWFAGGVPEATDVAGVARDLLVSGFYPVVVWTAPLAVGMWLGRRELRSPRTAAHMVAYGAAVAAIGFVLSDRLTTTVGTAASATDWRRLLMIVPHNGMPLWLLTSTAIAVAVVGACLLVVQRLPRATWPGVALGQLALTAYVTHLFVLHWWPQTLARDAFGAAWASVGRFTAVALLVAVAYRTVAARGPFEWLLRPSIGAARRGEHAADDGSSDARPDRRDADSARRRHRVPDDR